MRSRVVQIILLGGLVLSCRKNFDTLEEQPPSSVLQPQHNAQFVSSDTAVESEPAANGRVITKMYWLTSQSPASEGSPVTIKMNTSNVAAGTVVPYTVTGIDSNDVSSGNLSGNFVIGGDGTDSTIIIIKPDSVTEGTEVIKTEVKSIALAVDVTDASQTEIAEQFTNFLLDTIPYGDIDLLSPGRGANMFYNTQVLNILSAATGITSLDRDVRYSWWQLQKGAGSYDWSAIDADFKTCITLGQKISFRVMTLDTDASGYSSASTGGNKISYPNFLHSQMQGESVKDWSYGGSWIPNWNSPSYLSAWKNFCQALADHINSASFNGTAFKNVVFHIDLSGFGNYGEFHSYPFVNNYPSAAQKLTDASYKAIIDAQTSAFSNYPLIGNINMFVGEMNEYKGWYTLTTSNAWGKIGLRNDHFGWTATFKNDIQNNNRSYNGLSFKNEILNRWKYALICGEPMNNASAVTTGGSCAFWNFENEVRTYHASQFSNQNGTGISTLCLADNFRNASKAAGYRLTVKGGDFSRKAITLKWSNSGVAPVYENWDVFLEVRNGSSVVWSGVTTFKPKLFQPGTTSAKTEWGAIPAGSYSVYVIVKDPLGYRKPLPLANKNRQIDGSYKVADIKI